MYLQKKTYKRAAKDQKKNTDEDDKVMSLRPTQAINKNISTFDYAEASYLDDIVFDFKQFGKDDAELQEKSPIIFALK